MNMKETRKELDSDDDEVVADIDFSQCEEMKLRDGHYHIVFAHP